MIEFGGSKDKGRAREMKTVRRVASMLPLSAMLIAGAAVAQGKYDPGASDTDIKIGMTVPLSGPASAYGLTCAATRAFFSMVNDRGGVNGRKLTLLCEDDGLSPPKAIEKTRKLVESDNVLFIYNSQGTAGNIAVRRYLTQRQVPQILANSGAVTFDIASENPWTTKAVPAYYLDAKLFAIDIKRRNENARVGILYQADDFGRDYISGLKDGFGADAARFIVSEQPYQFADPTVDSQIVSLRNAGVDVVVLGALAKASAQAIRKIGELDWKPQIYLSWTSGSIPLVLAPAGLENAKGILTHTAVKDVTDPKVSADSDVRAYRAFMASYLPKEDAESFTFIYAYATSSILVDILKRAGDDLTRQNIMKMATDVDISPPLFMPGLRFKVTATERSPFKDFPMVRFDGRRWQHVEKPPGQ
ncbi:ABC transporter substrate-binding protein [Chelatococcus reniformis]|uniref:ABC transporter substrate-binding protein n=1 Tax=Chelatococcus reniformis TaxID=1494448 RepID=A0A916V004_9HYPH|nr:ABC transporter substrate-binding protein [Chelatococcus reniformis]GGC93837.1 ABC transporter substrate-binding protein [Chelatococcus reniformis]